VGTDGSGKERDDIGHPIDSTPPFPLT
jgi:hypothetical protein